MFRSSRFALTAVFAAAALSAAACSGNDTPAENTQSACDAYAEFSGTVSDARTSIDSSSTIEEIQAERDSIRNAYQDLGPALESVAEDRRTALDDAWKNFDDAVANIDESMTVPQAAASLSDDIDQIRSARDGLESDLGC
ncbi:hypothetical protein H9639_09135 [Arthrobacter sp. Sa2CUA1]|uniref:Uncharacterized protein n=2 Tax=Arthrobacter gallicola TaxID=2762225 RepID=A0ABR8USE1_9MICC|nr:hypothetical protein [Arthrobacter gallicola]